MMLLAVGGALRGGKELLFLKMGGVQAALLPLTHTVC